MPTVNKVRIYEPFHGDFAGYARTSVLKVRSGITDEDWHLIDELFIGLALIESGMASKSYARKMEEQLPPARLRRLPLVFRMRSPHAEPRRMAPNPSTQPAGYGAASSRTVALNP